MRPHTLPAAAARRAARRRRSRCRARAASCRPRARCVSAAASSAAPTPCRRARRCTSIFARSPRCGWFSGCAQTTWTVPTIAPAASSATSTTRSPRATLAATSRQNASALPRVIGSMKLTEAPPSTQSISTSHSACELALAEASETRGRRARRACSSPRVRPRSAGDHHDVARRLARAVAERDRLVELHRQAIVFGEAGR